MITIKFIREFSCAEKTLHSMLQKYLSSKFIELKKYEGKEAKGIPQNLITFILLLCVRSVYDISLKYLCECPALAAAATSNTVNTCVTPDTDFLLQNK